MSADTLTADAAPVTIAPPVFTFQLPTYAPVSYAASGNTVFVAYQNSAGQIAVAASQTISGALLFSQSFAAQSGNSPSLTSGPPVAVLTGRGDYAVTWRNTDQTSLAGPGYSNTFEVLGPGGDVFNSGQVGAGASAGPPAPGLELFTTIDGFRMEWDSPLSPPYPPATAYRYSFENFGGAIQTPEGVQTGEIASSPPFLLPYADASLLGPADLQVIDNIAQVSFPDSYSFRPPLSPVALPGEPAHAITQDAAVTLAGAETAAVAWVDSGTDYVSIFNVSTNSFGPVAGLDWGGASDLHLVALPDGGFVVSWMNGGEYKGEVFDAAGNGGGIISLAGDVAGIDSNGDLFTVALQPGQTMVQTYMINGSSGGGGTTGQTFNSDNNGDVWVGTAGNDVFNLGRGGDWVTGNGGDDTFKFAGIPWAGGHITDFNAGDVLDLTGLMSTTSDTGTDGFADGYLKITADSSGSAQVWADYHMQGNDGWWLVETLDGLSSTSLTHTGDVITVESSSGGGGPSAVSTADASYTAPANVTSITLTGSQQHIDASATSGVTINSNDTGNVLIGGLGDDTFHLGRGGDWVAGGGGADTFAYAGTPWAGGGITDFNVTEGDRIDVTGLLQSSGYTGSDPFADGYLKYTTDSSGNAQLWSDVRQVGNDGWWLVATLDGVSTSSLHYSGGMIT